MNKIEKEKKNNRNKVEYFLGRKGADMKIIIK